MTEVTLIERASDETIAAWLHQRIGDALRRQDGPIAVTVPGGSTPFPILQALTARPLDWDRIAVWPNDDRLVPEDHPASNTGKIGALLEPFGAEVVRLTEQGRTPRFALTWLGMGSDGHIASLFPNTGPQADEAHDLRRITPDPLPPEAPFDRITLTIPALLKTDELLFVIRGSDKRAIFEAAASGRSDLPVARLLAAARQPVTCFT